MENVSNLTVNEAIILQQVHEDGEDDMKSLTSQLGMSRHYILTIIERLKHKGLVAVKSDIDGLWVHLTRKGKQLMRHMWPEANSQFMAT